jgi:hypothetical protein
MGLNRTVWVWTDWMGLDRLDGPSPDSDRTGGIGLDRTGWVWTGLDGYEKGWMGLYRTVGSGQDWMGMDRTGWAQTEQGRTGCMGLDRTG